MSLPPEKQKTLAAFRKKQESIIRRTRHDKYPARAWSPSAFTCPTCCAQASQPCEVLGLVAGEEGVVGEGWAGKYHIERPGYQGSKRKKMRLVERGRI